MQKVEHSKSCEGPIPHDAAEVYTPFMIVFFPILFTKNEI